MTVWFAPNQTDRYLGPGGSDQIILFCVESVVPSWFFAYNTPRVFKLSNLKNFAQGGAWVEQNVTVPILKVTLLSARYVFLGPHI